MELKCCTLCPRECKVDRTKNQTGFCGALDQARVFRWGPHFGEEPPICGEHGSGAIFFSRCTLKCLYCQNSPWSWKGAGKNLSVTELTAIFRDLAIKHKCENWNLVSPTPYLPIIKAAVTPLIQEGIKLPFVYNSSGYERVESLKEFAQLCDVALVDLRYSNESTAKLASCANNYVAVSRKAVKYFWDTLGSLDSEEPGLAKRGVIVRILVLPGYADEAIENLAWLAATCGTNVHISLMSQYAPAYKALETPPFNRVITEAEYESVTEAAADFGFEKGWIQDFESRDPTSDLVGENMTEDEGTVGLIRNEE